MGQTITPRLYSGIWITVKYEGVCYVRTLMNEVATIKKAVIKEKGLDLRFKHLNKADPVKLRIEVEPDNLRPGYAIIKFTATQQFGFQGRIL